MVFYSEDKLKITFNYNLDIYIELMRCVQQFLSNMEEVFEPALTTETKEFTFSHLMFPNRSIEKGHIVADTGYFSLYISSVNRTFIKTLEGALKSCSEFRIQNQRVIVSNISVIKEPQFSEEMKFRMLSPALFAVRRGRKVIFLKPGDKAFSSVFEEKLLEAWSMIYKSSCEGRVKITLDEEYMKKANVTKLLNIDGVNYRTILAPFSLSGSVDLIRFAYRNGIGDKNRFGLGMIDTV